MLNHAFTLLYNRTGANMLGLFPDPSFTPLQLPSWVKSLRSHLFGAEEDATYVAARAIQLLKVLDAYPYSDFLDSLDPRVLYDVQKVRYMDLVGDSVQGPDDAAVSVSGQRVANAKSGRSTYTWSMTTQTDAVSVATEGSYEIEPVTITNDQTQFFDLPKTNLQASIKLSDGWRSGVAITLRVVTPLPEMGLSFVNAATKAMPYQLRELDDIGKLVGQFIDNPTVPVRIAGYGLGLIFAMESLR